MRLKETRDPCHPRPLLQVTLRNVPFKREYFRTEAGDVVKGRVAAIKHQLAAGHGLEDPDILLLRLGLSGKRFLGILYMSMCSLRDGV